MIIRKLFFSWIFLLAHTVCALSLAEEFDRFGYVEIFDQQLEPSAFDSLYADFDRFIEFLQINPVWAQKIYAAKERFIRSKERNYYSTDFFGFYDESKNKGRNQISFYYSTHFHEFICDRHPEFNQVPEIALFLNACHEIQKPHGIRFEQAASELGLDTLFSSGCGRPPILLKIVKYLPGYIAIRPHYDGSVFSLFLHSTDSQSLLFSPYKSSFEVADFFSPSRGPCSMLLIPGAFLAEFSINPTPHIVLNSGKIRYAAIAFAMRPNCVPPKNDFLPLPNFNR